MNNWMSSYFGALETTLCDHKRGLEMVGEHSVKLKKAAVEARCYLLAGFSCFIVDRAID